VLNNCLNNCAKVQFLLDKRCSKNQKNAKKYRCGKEKAAKSERKGG